MILFQNEYILIDFENSSSHKSGQQKRYATHAVRLAICRVHGDAVNEAYADAVVPSFGVWRYGWVY